MAQPKSQSVAAVGSQPKSQSVAAVGSQPKSSFPLYDQLEVESRSLDRVTIDLDDRINHLDADHAATVYQIILHHWSSSKKQFRLQTKFPYGLNGTKELIHGTTASFPIELQRILEVYLRQVQPDYP